MEIMPDHVHLFLECDPTFSVSEITNRLKGYTSRILRQEFSLCAAGSLRFGKFIVATGETVGASEALRVMMYASAEVSDDQLKEAYRRPRGGDGKRLNKSLPTR